MSRGGVSGVNVLVFCDKHRSRDMRRQNALGITGVYTSRNTDNAVFVIRAEPSQKKKHLPYQEFACWYLYGDYSCWHHCNMTVTLAVTL